LPPPSKGNKMLNPSEDRLSTLLSYEGKDKVMLWREFVLEKQKTNKSNIKIETKFPELDSALDCLIPGEVVVLSGLTGNGKTLFAKTMIRNFALSNVPCMVLSYEVTTEEFLRAFSESGFVHPFYVPAELKTGYLPWVEEKVIEAIVKFNNRVVLIDHLHYVVDMKTDKMTQNIGAAMRCLKEIAIKYQQIILLVAHQEKLKDDKEPGIETLRDSSFVGQEADVVVVVHRLPDAPKTLTFDQGYALVKVDKARRSGAYKRRLTFQKRGNWLEPL